MKISKSKQELARIISDNGGWRNGEFAAQDGDGLVGGYGSKPEWNSLAEYWWREASGGWFLANKIKNHHQTVLSRAEYFHLYPAPDAKPEFCESVMRSIPEPDEQVWTNPPTIEQLAADYQAKLDIATRAQEEADAHRCGAEVALSKLEIALKELVFKIETITAKQEPELVITDWRDLRVGDIIELTAGERYLKTECTMVHVPGFGLRARSADDTEALWWDLGGYQKSEWRFIRRP